MKIEYPHLKKIGGLRNFVQSSLLKILAVVIIATLAGYLGGHTVQKAYRNMTGYTPLGQVIMEAGEPESEAPKGVMLTIQNMADAVKDKSTDLVYKAINPPLKAMDWAAFWFSFVLAFMIVAWLSNKLINFERQVITGGVDPTVIKNMKILEDKVKELVDWANKRE